MYITLDTEDIKNIKKILSTNKNKEIGMIVSDTEIQYFKGNKNKIENIPLLALHNKIFGHTHPENVYDNFKAKYNPPSNQDILTSLRMPNNDSFIFEKAGIWIYRPNQQLIIHKNNKKFINHIDKYTEFVASQLINNEITVNTYLNKLKKIIIYDNKILGMIIKFFNYSDVSEIKLKNKII